MITNEQEISKYCCLYVSEFHLEMILLPYIKHKIEKSKVIIFTEKNLKGSVEFLLDRLNLNNNDKKILLNIDSWETNEFNQEYEKNQEYTIIINGDEEYRNKVYKKIEKIPSFKINIIDCYNLNSNNINKQYIKINYDKILNTEKFNN